MTEPQVISMTDNAARRVAEIAVKLGKPPILRLSVEGGGCSGFQYRFGLADAVETDDIRAEGTGASLVVDPISLDLVRGSAVDVAIAASQKILAGRGGKDSADLFKQALADVKARLN